MTARHCPPPTAPPLDERQTEPQVTLPHHVGPMTSADLDANPWAACGQAALAALVGRSLASVRDACPRRRRPWMNFADMARALQRLGVAGSTFTGGQATQDLEQRTWPPRGLVLVQWGGPWEANPREAPKYTHWIAVAPLSETPVVRRWKLPPAAPMAFDVNVVEGPYIGGWAPRGWWEQCVAPELAMEHPGATGAWSVRSWIEVER